jgi:methylmalonyl-CoA carboxyltransferase large subunit
MKTTTEEHRAGAQELDQLRRDMARLIERVTALESAVAAHAAAGQRAAAPSTAAPPQAATATVAAGTAAIAPPPGEISPEVLAVIAAVLAAHLGVKPHLRQVSLAGGGSWAQQGRVTIQASHALAIQRD